MITIRLPAVWPRALSAAGLVLALAWSGAIPATPFLPKDDGELVERLPAALNAADRALRELQEQLLKSPQNLELATQVARRLIERGRAESDPRYYGYAQAALRPWWDQRQPPPAVLLLRATLGQNRHEFAAALADLARVLEVQPRNAQAWLTRAVILQVQGDYLEARRSCARLLNLTEPLVTAICAGSVAGLQGQSDSAYQLVRQTLTNSPQADAKLRVWALTVLAELAARKGDVTSAEKHFQEALDVGIRDSYLLGAYADWLLDQGYAERARELLKEETRADGLLLRLALAERQIGADEALKKHIASLSARFEASRQRGDTLHLRDQARALLHLMNQPQAALELAQRNWAVQREPWDARLLLEAALAAGKPEAAQPAMEWLAQSGLQDVRLAELTKQLEGRL